MQELNRTAATRALPDDPYGDDAGFVGKIIDWFNKIGDPVGAAGALTMDAVRLAIAGAGGRMGQALIEAALAMPDVVLAAALDVAGSPALGRDAGERFGRATGVIVGADIRRGARAVPTS